MAFNDSDDTLVAKAEKRMAQALATSQAESDEYVDQTPGQAMSRRDINIMALRSLLLQASFNYERMQAGGWLYTLIPSLRKIHRNPQDLANSMKMHMEFINVHPFDVTFLSGLVLAMERGKERVSTIRAVKVALMGPLGGIGDALFWLTLLPICAGIGAAGAGGESVRAAGVPAAVQRGALCPALWAGALWLQRGNQRAGAIENPYQKYLSRRLDRGHDGDRSAGGLLCSPLDAAGDARRQGDGGAAEGGVGQVDAQPAAPVLHPAGVLADEAGLFADQADRCDGGRGHRGQIGWLSVRDIRQGIVITGDGGFASGLRQGVEQVVGVQMPCQAVDVPDGMSTVGLSQSLAEACQRCDSGDGSSATAMSFWPKPIADGGRKMVLEREGLMQRRFAGRHSAADGVA